MPCYFSLIVTALFSGYTLDNDSFHKKLYSKRQSRNQKKQLMPTPERKRNINRKQDIGKPTTEQKQRRSRSLDLNKKRKGKNNKRRRSTGANSEKKKRQLQRIIDVHLRSGVRHFMVQWDDGEKTCELAQFINICSPQKVIDFYVLHLNLIIL